MNAPPSLQDTILDYNRWQQDLRSDAGQRGMRFHAVNCNSAKIALVTISIVLEEGQIVLKANDRTWTTSGRRSESGPRTPPHTKYTLVTFRTPVPEPRNTMQVPWNDRRRTYLLNTISLTLKNLSSGMMLIRQKYQAFLCTRFHPQMQFPGKCNCRVRAYPHQISLLPFVVVPLQYIALSMVFLALVRLCLITCIPNM